MLQLDFKLETLLQKKTIQVKLTNTILTRIIPLTHIGVGYSKAHQKISSRLTFP
jgi:hypothetical protein